jgi:uncharacterized protein YeaO (DUF488 family)
MAILLKCADEPFTEGDGARILVELQLPDGSQEDSLALRAWLAALAPSEKLSQWFDQRPRQWLLFRRRYLAELGADAAIDALGTLHDIAAAEAVTTLLTHSEHPERSHAAILRDLLQGSRKPPSSTGPARMAASRAHVRRKP